MAKQQSLSADLIASDDDGSEIVPLSFSSARDEPGEPGEEPNDNEVNQAAEKKKKKKESRNVVEEILRKTAADSLQIGVAKRRTFADAAEQECKRSKKPECRLETLRNVIPPERFALIPKQPCLSADSDFNGGDLLVLPASSESKPIGKRTDRAFYRPAVPALGLDLLNRQLDVRIAAARTTARQRLSRQVMEHSSRKASENVQKDETNVNKRASDKTSMFDRAALVRSETKRALERQKQLAQKESDEFEGELDESEESEDEEFFRDSISNRPEGLIDDEAGSGSSASDVDDDKPVESKRKKRPVDDEEHFDANQYREDLRGFVAKAKPLNAGDVDRIRRIQREQAMQDDQKTLDVLVRRLNLPEGSNASWMQHLHDSYGSQEPLAEAKKTTTTAEEKENHRERLEKLVRLGFARERSVRPADNRFLFAEETQKQPLDECPALEEPTSTLLSSEMAYEEDETDDDGNDAVNDRRVPLRLPSTPHVHVEEIEAKRGKNLRDFMSMMKQQQQAAATSPSEVPVQMRLRKQAPSVTE